ncbi:helix-turn-helix domain-containing protein [Saccharopolyspora phatthalungensis]|uniref:Transcriptional regulator with XRE-family HTH domain n=1 Tax=Saccharopolyspora phatthalungensis TaxID=664693 RepID=A0A840QG69_9PSEU|nr:helix-turn-helix transcriptional regulator [Saccharopolyspora phatthalungensis]MBB5159091.1 transcriptional regulator with XRE-family HTH domain [Saccharopolyspora phatthalungensis]
MNGPRQRCQCCGTVLRVGVNDALCGPCARAAGFREPIPEGFYEDTDLRTALETYDFGAVFTAVRQQTGLSQLQLADLLGLSQSRVSAVERGERRLTHVRTAARMATVLRIPAPLLGFPTGHTVTGNETDKEVSWLERRDFLSLVTAATLGSSLNPELARLGSLLPGQAEPVTRPRIGAADVDAIEAITEGFRRSSVAHGGGLCRAAATTQLHQARRLEDALCSPEIRTRLLVAIANHARIAGWAAYDVDDHDAARRLWTYALDTAHRAADDHPRATDLAVRVLLDMAHQALHLERASEALRLVQLASATAANRKHPVGAITQGYTSAVLGWCRAALGEPEPTRRAIGQAQETYAAADPATTPPWTKFVTDAEITGQQGYSLYLLSLSRPEFAPEAIEKLTSSTTRYGAEYERTRAVTLPPLASAQFQAGDIDAAVATGYDAVNAISGLSSTRGYARLRVLDTVAAPHSGKSEVADLREHIRTALTTTA